ncbi:MAG: alpha/beta fold hydrolase [Planctomycetaceae bacterium]|nr:alpha/beta fold hydrolase [Planctomycetales bacterium]MCB9937188.1 alpha/beta fold hydrolase [Planctomycetaceae bacterium]
MKRTTQLCLLFMTLATVTFADDPITRSPQLPATMPWDLDELSKPPEFAWQDIKSSVRSLSYAGEPYQGKPTRVFAYYASPGTLNANILLDRNLPAVVLVHGGGGTAFREWAELWAKRGYAAIAMDLAGYRPHEGVNQHQRENRTRLEEGGPDQGDDEKFGSVDKDPAEQWPYHAVANVIRAHSLIRSFASVDSNRTAVTGISWGGYLTCIVSGVDSRFKAAVPVYGCGFLHENSAWLDRFGRMTAEQRERWVTLWDPSRYLPAVSMPILFVNGTNDFAYPLDSYMKSIAAVPGEKQFCITVKMPHGHPAGWAPPEIGLFIDSHLQGGQPLATVDSLRITDGKAQTTYQSEVPITKAELHFTTDTKPINQREWQSTPATISSEVINADAPPADTTAWFFTLTDSRGAVSSSTVQLVVLADPK